VNTPRNPGRMAESGTGGGLTGVDGRAAATSPCARGALRTAPFDCMISIEKPSRTSRLDCLARSPVAHPVKPSVCGAPGVRALAACLPTMEGYRKHWNDVVARRPGPQ
jgi:hypothetical protein